MTQLLYDPVDLGNYAKRGDPPIDEWPGIPVGRERIMASSGDPVVPLKLLSGGLLAKAYLRAVFQWIPSSRAIARRDSPLSLACCTFSHRVLWRAVGILCCCALDLRGRRSRSTSPVSNLAKQASDWPSALLALWPTPEPSMVGDSGCSQQTGAWWSLLCRDGPSLVLHQGADPPGPLGPPLALPA